MNTGPVYAHQARGDSPDRSLGLKKLTRRGLAGRARRHAALPRMPSNGLLYRMRHNSPDATDAAPYTQLPTACAIDKTPACRVLGLQRCPRR